MYLAESWNAQDIKAEQGERIEKDLMEWVVQSALDLVGTAVNDENVPRFDMKVKPLIHQADDSAALIAVKKIKIKDRLEVLTS